MNFLGTKWAVAGWVAVVIAASLVAFDFGIESQRSRHWVAASWSKARAQLTNPLPPAIRDRSPVPCPAAAMVVLVVGQSHGANYVLERFVGMPGVFNAYRGKCYPALDPLLGPEGDKGNVWTAVGNGIVTRGLASDVVILNSSIGSSKLYQWVGQGSLNPHLRQTMASVPPGLAITHVAIQIGEGDYAEGTSARQFRRGLSDLVDIFRAEGIAGPVFIARESLYCSPARTENPIATAQRTFRAPGVHPGPNMDALPFGRYDNCHLSGPGAQELAGQWIEVLFPDAAPIE